MEMVREEGGKSEWEVSKRSPGQTLIIWLRWEVGCGCHAPPRKYSSRVTRSYPKNRKIELSGFRWDELRAVQLSFSREDYVEPLVTR